MSGKLALRHIKGAEQDIQNREGRGEVFLADHQGRDHQAEAQLALGLTSKSRQTLGELAQSSSPQVKAAAQARIEALRAMEVHRVDLTRPNLGSLDQKMQQALEVQTQAVAQIGARHDEGHSQLKSLQQRLDTIGYELPDFSRIEVKRGSRLEAVEKNLTAMARSVNSAIGDSSSAIDNVGSVDTKTNKPGGRLKENGAMLSEMQAPLKLNPIPSDSIEVFPSYPQMFTELSAADGDMVRSAYKLRADDGDWGQPRTMVREVLDDEARERLVSNVAGHLLDGVSDKVLARAFEYWRNVDAEIGERIEQAGGATVGA